MSTTLLILIILLLLLASGGWGYTRGWYGPTWNPIGILVLVLVIVLIVWLLQGVLVIPHTVR